MMKHRQLTPRTASIPLLLGLSLSLGIAEAGRGPGPGPGGAGDDRGDPTAGEALFRHSCSGCHTFGHGDHFGPDLAERKLNDGWTSRFLTDPEWATTYTGYGRRLLQEWGYVMPDFELTQSQIDDLLAFFTAQDVLGPLEHTAPAELSEGEFSHAMNTYFDRCAGCHGLYRTGATGPDIGVTRSEWIGTDGLGALMRYGSAGGMPDFGDSGLLTEEDITLLAAYLQQPPPEPPALPMEDIQASWNLSVPVADRPTEPEHERNWENFFGVVLRDAGQIAIFDGDSHEEVARLDVGFAVHILRSSSSGRYYYAIGRDGLVSLIDLWSSEPAVVATVKGCHDARSVDGSKFTGYEEQYLIEGCYWPPQYVTFDGLTLEPLARVDLPMTSIDGDTLPENRVASIVASPFEPTWVISLKESGYVGIVDYSQPDFPLVASIATERFLHDGGWDHSGRYFMVAANASDKMVVVDVSERALAASFTTGATPHPGRGANWEDPVYGWVNATPHIGENTLAIYGADPQAHPEYAWQVVRKIELPSAGSLFVKTHPNTPWVLIDMTLSSDGSSHRQVCAYSKADAVIDRCFDVATQGRAVHFEFNQDGSEVWVSDWAQDGATVILDSQTLTEIDRIEGLTTPTGKFNVHNTAHEVY
ncbi:nitrite reductase [Thiohalobacter thiocyanaticus]|uniref:Nitrite reductase n=1 Tax=Thiohalobacter thiocyanaticus TaxID=585455 RepID=A0A1Z4VNB8_9GAMM|nr:nitrite reductase [Thiohalobacter thiocyanaticus]BAZ93109.1 nitrite reductase [Thiohalobacter thiocyanaticus]